MLLKIFLSLATLAAVRFVIFSDNPEFIELRAQLYGAAVKAAKATSGGQGTELTNLEKLHARVLAEANPCTEVVCPGDEGEPAQQIKSLIEATEESRRNFNPKFLTGKP